MTPEVHFTHVDRLLWPELGFRKADLLAYYRGVAPALLPQLRGHATTLARFPEGIHAHGWYQMNCRGPDWMRRWRHTTPAGEVLDYAVIDDLPSLLWVANQGSIELHPYLPFVDAPELLPVAAFDLDPGDGAGPRECARAALRIRERLAEDGLAVFPKTSGRRGLHLLSPLDGTSSAGAVLAYVRQVAAELKAQAPELFVLTLDRSKRAGKVLLDVRQNHPMRSLICAYSMRAMPRPRVSVPLTWDEVEQTAHGHPPAALDLTPAELLRRLDAVGDLYAPVLRPGPRLPTLRSGRC